MDSNVFSLVLKGTEQWFAQKSENAIVCHEAKNALSMGRPLVEPVNRDCSFGAFLGSSRDVKKWIARFFHWF